MPFLLGLVGLFFLTQSLPSSSHAEEATAKTCEATHAQNWIAQNFSDATIISGDFTGRQELETPAWLRDASGSEARYAFSIRDKKEPLHPRVAFTNVRISNLRSSTHYGAGIKTHRNSPGMQLFLSNVVIEPNWPDWISYGNTNYDGMVLDGAEALYAHGLSISGWNADSAIDNKARVSQLVDLHISGPGHRPLRYWHPGPHYLVHATIDKHGTDTLIWFENCDDASLYVYKSLFNGQDQLTDGAISCETGTEPKIIYLDKDPRKTGEMHDMFHACDIKN